LLEAGVHSKLVQHLLGHSTVALTLNTYNHVDAQRSTTHWVTAWW
jgi:site-specific recombinase XerD